MVVMKKNISASEIINRITVNITVTMSTMFKLRCKIGLAIMKLGVLVMGCGVNIKMADKL